MKKPSLVIISIVFLLSFAVSVTAFFGRDSFTFSFIRPLDGISYTVNNTDPKNFTNSSFSLTLWYRPDDLSLIANCSLMINDNVNHTNSIPQKNFDDNFEFRVPSIIPSVRYYNWSISCTDIFGNENRTDVRKFTLIVDNTFLDNLTAPIITIVNPINQSTITTNSTWLNVTTDEDAVCHFGLEGESCTGPLSSSGSAGGGGCGGFLTNFTRMNITGEKEHLQNITLIDKFSYTTTVSCSDEFNNTNKNFVSFKVNFSDLDDINVTDTTPPNISIMSPINGSRLNADNVLINITTNESANCTYHHNSCPYSDNLPPDAELACTESFERELSNTGGTSHSALINTSEYHSSFVYNFYTVFLTCSDTLNNSNSATVSFAIDKTSPTINITNPENSSIITTNSTWLNVTTNEYSTCSFHGDGCPINESSPPAECDELVPKNMPTTDGFAHYEYITNLKDHYRYDIAVACEDNLGNSNNKFTSFDAAIPQSGSGGGGGGGGGIVNITSNLTITVNSPQNNSIIKNNSVSLDIATGSYAICKYSLDSNPSNFLDRTVVGSPDAWRVGTSTKILEMSETLSSGSNIETIRNITTFIDDSEINALASGEATNSKGDAPYDQFLYLLGPGASINSGYVIYTENDQDVTADFLFFKSGEEIGRYLLEFTTALESDVDDSSGTASSIGLFLTDFEGVDITMLGKRYTIVQARRISTAGNNVKLVLMTGVQKDTLIEGNTKTYNLGGTDYELTLNFVDADEAQFVVNGEPTRKLKEGDTDKLSDGANIGVSDILYQDYAGGIHSATFFIGAEKLELKDFDVTDVASSNSLKADDETIDDALVIVEATDDNSTFKINRIHINMTADDDFFVGKGAKLSQNADLDELQVLFTNNWDYEYKGLSEQPTEEIKITAAGKKKYELHFKDGDGNEAKLPLAQAVGANTLEFGEKNKALINWENRSIVKDDYIILTDGSEERGRRKTYVLQYKGADKSAADSPVLKFRNLGSGEVIEQPYSALGSPEAIVGPSGGKVWKLATLKIGGADFSVYNDSGILNNDFNIIMDLNAQNSIEHFSKTINITSYNGMEIGIQNETNPASNSVIVSFKTPDNKREEDARDNVETLQATDFVVSVNVVNGSVKLAELTGFTNAQNGAKLNLMTPDGETGVAYGYTSYGTFIKYETPLSEPNTVTIQYPKRQREALVYITSQQTENRYKQELSNLEDGEHTIDIICKYSFGKLSNYHLRFNIATGLYVNSHSPANGSVNVSVKENINAIFNHNVSKSSLKNNMMVKDLKGKNVHGRIYYNETTKELIFDPIMFLKHNKTYIVNITTGVNDTAGNNLKEDYVWKFTTALKDTDDDGIPDDEDDDADNDGVDDDVDFVKGNVSHVNSNFKNLSFIIGNESNVSKVFNGTKKVQFRLGNKKILEFDFNFSDTSQIDLTNLSILNASNSSAGAVVISGLKLPEGFTKTVDLEKISLEMDGVCIKDEDIVWVSEISDSCAGSNEFKIECDGTLQDGYRCTYNSSDDLYTITGLKHSGIKQFDYSKPSEDSGSPSGGGGSGGGGGGSGGGGGGVGAFYICNMDWKCDEWSDCKNGKQTRLCSFVKVPQHSQNETCPQESKLPLTLRSCAISEEVTVPKHLPINKTKVEERKETVGAKQPKEEAEPEKLTTEGGLASVTGAAVRKLFTTKDRSLILDLPLLAIITIATTVLFWRRSKKISHKKRKSKKSKKKVN